MAYLGFFWMKASLKLFNRVHVCAKVVSHLKRFNKPSRANQRPLDEISQMIVFKNYSHQVNWFLRTSRLNNSIYSDLSRCMSVSSSKNCFIFILDYAPPHLIISFIQWSYFNYSLMIIYAFFSTESPFIESFLSLVILIVASLVLVLQPSSLVTSLGFAKAFFTKFRASSSHLF